MKTKAAWMIAGLLCAGVAQSTEPVRSIDWTVAAEAGRLPDGVELVTNDGHSFIEISHAGPGGLAVPLATVEGSEIDALQWAMRGKVRYEDVVAGGFLEMWSVFPDGARYFSRTAAAEGPMAVLQGSSDWREFTLPFTSSPGVPPPVRLELNLVLQGAGTVWLGPVDVIEVVEGGADAAR